MVKGSKVICVDANYQLHGGLVEGKIYIIKSLKFDEGYHITGIYIDGFEYPHKIERFKIVDETFSENLLKNIKQQVKDELGDI